MKTPVVLFFLLFISLISLCQTREMDSLKQDLKGDLADTTRVKKLNWLSWLYCTRSNYDSAIISSRSALLIAEKISFSRGIMLSHINIGNIYVYRNNNILAFKNYLKALYYADSLKQESAIADLNSNIGLILLNQGDYAEAVKYYFSAINVFEKLNEEDRKAIVYTNLGLIYEKMKNYPEALSKYDSAIRLATIAKDTETLCYCKNYLVEVAFKVGDYAKALELGNEAKIFCEKYGNATLVSDAEYNLGQVYYKLGNLAEGYKYYTIALEKKQKLQDRKSTAKIKNDIGLGLLAEEKPLEAEEYLTQALTIADSIGAKENIDDIYWSLIHLDSAKGDYKSGYYNYRNYLIYKDSINNEQVSAKIVTEQLTYDFDRKQALEKAEVEKKEARQRVIRNIFFFCFLIAILFAAVFLRQRRRIAKELFLAKVNLQDYVKDMAEKSSALEEFQEEINKLKNSTDEQRVLKLQSLNRSSILTDGDWNQFRLLFEQVYPGLLSRLKIKLPDLTPGETRLVCLTKLSIGTKQMAGILGVSDDTIRKTRYRLRKKLGLAEENTLDDVVNSI